MLKGSVSNEVFLIHFESEIYGCAREKVYFCRCAKSSYDRTTILRLIAKLTKWNRLHLCHSVAVKCSNFAFYVTSMSFGIVILSSDLKEQFQKWCTVGAPYRDPILKVLSQKM